MKLVQVLTLAYIVLGVAAGYISNLLVDRSFAVASALSIYGISYIVLSNLVAYKKRNWLISNSLVTFILVWLVVWIFLFNI